MSSNGIIAAVVISAIALTSPVVVGIAAGLWAWL